MHTRKIEEVEHIIQTSKPEGVNREVAFTDEFKDFVSRKENIGLMTEAKRLIDTLAKETESGKKVEGGRFSVEYIASHHNIDGYRYEDRKYFRVKINDGSGDFFVKVNYDSGGRYEQGADELLELKQLREEIEKFNKLGEFKTRVPEYCLGYKDGDSTYLVTKYEDFMRENCDDLLERMLRNPKRTVDELKFAQEILRRVQRLRKYEVEKNLGHKDFGGNNMAYDKENDEMVVFDVR